jgi:hypothetical protein
MLNSLSIQTQFKSSSNSVKETKPETSSDKKTTQVTKSSFAPVISKPIKSATAITSQKISQPAKPAQNGNHNTKNGAGSDNKINILV